MYRDEAVKVGALCVAGVEAVGAIGVQVVASAAIKSTLGKQEGLVGLGSLLQKASDVGVMDSSRAEALRQVITNAQQVVSGGSQQVADACEALRQGVEGSSWGGIVKITCDNASGIVGGTFEAAIKELRTELLDSGEHLLGGLRMAGIMGLASIFLSKRLTEEWNRVLDNEFLAFVAAQGTLALGSAAVNSFVLAPIAKLSWSAGDMWRDVGVGFGMGIVTIFGEIVARRMSNLEDLGPSIGVFGMALLKARGAIQGASALLRFL